MRMCVSVRACVVRVRANLCERACVCVGGGGCACVLVAGGLLGPCFGM